MDDVPESSDQADRGLSLMGSMLGDSAVERITKRNKAIAPAWHRWTTEVLFGDLWQRSVLGKRERSLVTVAALIPMAKPRELAIHMRAAMSNGVTFEELVEIAQHVGFYAGWPAAGEALNILSELHEPVSDTDH